MQEKLNRKTFFWQNHSQENVTQSCQKSFKLSFLNGLGVRNFSMGISKFGQKLTLFFILNIENNMNILIDNWCSIICNTDKKVMELLIERHNIVCIVKAAVTAKSVNYAHFWCPNGRLGLSQKKISRICDDLRNMIWES